MQFSPKRTEEQVNIHLFFLMYGVISLGGYMLGKVLLYFPIQRLFEVEGVILIAMGTFLFLKTPKSISEDLVVK